MKSENTAQVNKVIDDLSTNKKGSDFYLNSNLVSPEKNELRPFAFDSSTFTDNHSEDEQKSIESKFHFNPNFDIGLIAMCNDSIDHKLLGLLTLKIAEAVNGIIYFDGDLDEKKIKNIKGKIFSIDYETANGHIAQYHVSDIEFMRGWLANENFYMIK